VAPIGAGTPRLLTFVSAPERRVYAESIGVEERLAGGLGVVPAELQPRPASAAATRNLGGKST
jgi:hypothetical protein